jgi:hypothetical protein
VDTDLYVCQPIVVAVVESEASCHLAQVIVRWVDAPVLEEVPNQSIVILPEPPCGYILILTRARCCAKEQGCSWEANAEKK